MGDIKIIPAEQMAQWNRYAAMSRDTQHTGVGNGDGVLMQDELKHHIDVMRAERDVLVRDRQPTENLDRHLDESLELLQDMEVNGVDGLTYLPPELDQLPDGIKRRATEVLLKDDIDGIGHISQDVLDRARARYYDMIPRSGHMLQVRDAALQELTAIAEALNLH